jgi:hypothetical protein
MRLTHAMKVVMERNSLCARILSENSCTCLNAMARDHCLIELFVREDVKCIRVCVCVFLKLSVHILWCSYRERENNLDYTSWNTMNHHRWHLAVSPPQPEKEDVRVYIIYIHTHTHKCMFVHVCVCELHIPQIQKCMYIVRTCLSLFRNFRSALCLYVCINIYLYIHIANSFSNNLWSRAHLVVCTGSCELHARLCVRVSVRILWCVHVSACVCVYFTCLT